LSKLIKSDIKIDSNKCLLDILYKVKTLESELNKLKTTTSKTNEKLDKLLKLLEVQSVRSTNDGK